MDNGAECALGELADERKSEPAVDMCAFQAAGTRLKKGGDGNTMKFYKGKCEILHLGWNNPVQLYGMGSQVPGKQLYRKGLEGPGIR